MYLLLLQLASIKNISVSHPAVIIGLVLSSLYVVFSIILLKGVKEVRRN